MKKQGILQHKLAETIASLGHGDLLIVADAGLPIPPGSTCIDLAVRCGLPAMLDVTTAIAEEMKAEEMIVASELMAREAHLPEMLRSLFADTPLRHVPHEEFKSLSARARAIVRTGECTPYHNVILRSGVVF